MHEKLYKYRKAAHLTQVDIARYLGITSQQYGKRERGHISFTLAEAKILATVLSVSVMELFPEYFF